MGLFSDIKAAKDVQKLKQGGQANLSISQVVNLITNMPDAQKNLSNKEFEQVYSLYKQMRKCSTKIPVNLDGYFDMALEIIQRFDSIAPYEKYSGGNEIEFSFLMDKIRGKDYKKIQGLKKQISDCEISIKQSKDAITTNAPILAECYSDEELRSLVKAGEFTAEQAKEYADQRDILRMTLEFAPKNIEFMSTTLRNLKAELAELEQDI